MAVTAAAGGGGGLTCRRPPTPDCHCAARLSDTDMGCRRYALESTSMRLEGCPTV